MAFHSLALRSSDPVTMILPSGLKATQLIHLECCNVSNIAPNFVSHTVAVCRDPVTMVLPSGLKATQFTRSECCNVSNFAPDLASHTLTAGHSDLVSP